MAAHVCKDTSEAVELCPSKGLFLKPVSKVTILVTLPEIREVGVTISNWEVMEKVKSMVAPTQFTVLRVVESSLEKIRFEGEVDTKSLLARTVEKLDGNMIKLSGLADPLKVRTYESKIKYPVKHDWESFFRDAKDLNEWKPGERPDTVHLKGLPSKWFSDRQSSNKPSKEVVISVFERYGKIRCVDIPSLDPYRTRMTRNHQPNFQTFCFGSDLHFEVYIQYEDYQGFVSAMRSLKGMKLLLLSDTMNCAATAAIQFDFDRSCHLSEANIMKRNAERRLLIENDRLEELQKRREKEEEERRKEEERRRAEEHEAELLRQAQENQRKREERRKAREERRRQRREEKRRLERERKAKQKELLVERKRIEDLREEQARNLFTDLFRRIASSVAEEKEQKRKREEELEILAQIKKKKQKLEKELKRKEEEEAQKKKQMEEDEKQLRDKLLKNLQVMKERRAELEREILRKQIQGKTKMLSVVKTNS